MSYAESPWSKDSSATRPTSSSDRGFAKAILNALTLSMRAATSPTRSGLVLTARPNAFATSCGPVHWHEHRVTRNDIPYIIQAVMIGLVQQPSYEQGRVDNNQ